MCALGVPAPEGGIRGTCHAVGEARCGQQHLKSPHTEPSCQGQHAGRYSVGCVGSPPNTQEAVMSSGCLPNLRGALAESQSTLGQGHYPHSEGRPGPGQPLSCMGPRQPGRHLLSGPLPPLWLPGLAMHAAASLRLHPDQARRATCRGPAAPASCHASSPGPSSAATCGTNQLSAQPSTDTRPQRHLESSPGGNVCVRRG